MAIMPAESPTVQTSDLEPEVCPTLTEDQLLAWRAFFESSQLLEAMLDRSLKPVVGLSHADYGVLRRLQDANGHRMSMRDLRHAVWFSRSRLSHQVKRLVASGLIVKAVDAEDGRRQMVALTEAGLRTTRSAQNAARQVLRDHFFDHLAPQETQDLASILQSVVWHLREQPECQAFRNS